MLVAVLATVLLPVASARAEGGFNAQWVAQSPDVTLESGETVTSWLEYRNVDQNGQAWVQRHADVTGDVRLGTSDPRDRSSAFAHSSWVQSSRPARLDQASVPLNGIGRFTFVALAPPVPAEIPYKETFDPVAEVYGWMADPHSITYTVRPKVPPVVGITAAPARVTLGSPVTVTAGASDNVRVNRVEFRIGAGAPVVDTQAPYEAQLPTTGLGAGDQALTVTAVDGAGQATAATQTVALDPVANGAGAVRDAKLTAGFGRHLSARHTVDYGRADRVRGRLTTGAGAPLAGATLQVATRIVAVPLRGYRPLTTVVTAADGTYSYLAPKGASRQILVSYTAFSGDATPAAARVVRMSTRAGVRLSARRTGSGIRLSGRLRGGPKPTRGLLAVLQGRQPGFGWKTFGTARIGSGGRFSATYRWRSAARGTFGFRVTVREQLGYAYATGRSRVISVRR
jgi:hypothetical protein